MKHLRNRVFFQILIPVLIVFLILSIGAFLLYRNSYKESVIEGKQTEFLNVSRLLSDWLAGRMRELMIIANSEMFSGQDNEESRQFLQNRLNRQAYKFTSFWIIERSGMYWTTENRTGQLSRNVQFPLLFSGEKLFMYRIPADFEAFGSERFILFAVPVIRNDMIVSLIGGVLPVSEINWMLDLYTSKMFDSVALINLDTEDYHSSGGFVIAHSNKFHNGKSEREVYGSINTTSRQLKNEIILVTSLITNWKFIGQISSKNLFYQINAFSRLFFLIIFFIILAIGVLAVGISQLIAKPVVTLTEMVNKMLQGDFTHTISVKTNDELTSLANAFNLLNRRNIQLRTNDRFSFLGKISSRMAHEIRHPLHVIQVAIETMNKENYSKTKEIMSQEIKKAEMFIREILEISKPNELSLQYYSLSKLIKGIFRKYELIEQQKGVCLILDCNAEFDSFYFDVLKIEQVITNIINNSFDILEEGGKVYLDLFNDDNRNLVLKISDTGPGFDLSRLDRVFDPYFTTKKNGTGLGLSICYQILTAHGAHIEIGNSSTGGAETTIVFSIFSENQIE